MKNDLINNRNSYGRILGVGIVAFFMVMTASLAVTLFSTSSEAINTCTLDFGDAPDPTYPTNFSNNGARHNIEENDLYLGTSRDAEADGQPSATATGDDNDGNDDEDGVTFLNYPLETGVTANIIVNASGHGKLDAWVDFNGDGDWADAGEKIFNSVALAAGDNYISFFVPKDAAIAQTFARFRFSLEGGLNFNGSAPVGEVEDYEVYITCEQIPPNYWQNFIPSGWWTTDQTPDCSVEVKDLESGLDVSTAEYRYSTDGGSSWSGWAVASCTGVDGTNSYETISVEDVPFNQDSKDQNKIEFRIDDMCGNTGTATFIVKVDTEGPIQTVEFGILQEQYYYAPGDKWFTVIGGNTLIYINSTDAGIGSSNLTYYIQWGDNFGSWPYVSVDVTTVEDNQVVPGNPFETDADPTVGKISVQIYEDESCWHEVHFWCIDELGHRAPLVGGNFTDFIVDVDAPVSDWSFMGPTYPGNVWMGNCTYKIINASDVGCIPDGSGVAKIDWFIHRIIGVNYELYQSGTVIDDGDGDYNPVDGKMSIRIKVDEDCEHYISYRVFDDVYNYDVPLGIETPNKQFHKIDVTPPETYLSYQGAYCYDEEDEMCVNTNTVITINTNNVGEEPCIYPETMTFFRVFVVDENQWYPDSITGLGNYGPYGASAPRSSWKDVYWYDYTESFNFTEECVHYLEFFAKDPLCNTEETHNITHYVDDQPPLIEKTVGEPKCPVPGTDDYCVTTSTEITLSATDQGCCPSEEFYFEYRIWYDGIWTPWMEYTGVIIFDEECMHYLEVRGEDCIGNQAFDNETFYVDDTPPTIIKTVGDPNCTIPGTPDYCVTTDTLITLEATDDDCCPLSNITIEYKIGDGNWQTYTDPFSFDEECEHVLTVRAYDCLGNGMDCECWDIETFYVDDSEPIINKVVGEPKCPVPDTDDWCVTTSTEITVTAEDQGCGPCSQDLTIEYRIWYDGVWTPWTTYTDPISFTEECMHYLEIRAYDCLGNTKLDNETFYVDDTEPTIIKTVGEPKCPVPGTDDWCVTTDTLITLEATDDDCCPLSNITIEYKIGDGNWQTYTDPFSFDEECEHVLTVRAYDCLGNGMDCECWDIETFYVDDSEPIINKVVGEPKCPVPDTDDWCVTTSTEITVTAEDQGCGPCSQDLTIEYRIWYDGVWTSWMTYVNPISFTEECMHYLELRVSDCLGNEATDNETFYVDDQAPDITKTVSEPKCPVPGTDDYCITSQTYITLSAVDQGCGPCNEVTLKYRVWYNDQWTDWMSYYDPIYMWDECMHYLEVKATDCLGNEELDNETFYVDDTPPTIIKTVGDPNCTIPGTPNYCVTTDTLITLEATDDDCCPLSNITIEYKIGDGNWQTYTDPFSFDEECEHVLTVRAYDCLGNGMDCECWDIETFYVDDSEPIINKVVGEPKCPVPDTDDWCVTTSTEITVTAEDQGCGPCSQDVTVEYRIWYDGIWTPWTTYTDPISFTEECMHYLEIRAYDCLGNTKLDNETFYVDDTEPTIIKTVGEPKCPVPGTDDWCVTTDTLITLEATDDDCCPLSNITIEYKIGDGNWQTYTDPFSFDEECEHVLTVRAYDCLGNGMDCECWDIETFYVDDSEPIINKVVGEPKCPVPDTDDWCVTTSTEITVTAEDQGCGPCSQDLTIEYRIWYDGVWTSWMTYTDPISFTEECMHYLEFRVSDCLGNEAIHNETFYVDDSEPIINKVVGEPKYQLPGTDDYCVTTDTEITITATDQGCGPCGNDVTLEYRIWFNGQWTDWMPYQEVIQFTEECMHYLEIRATDCLGNYALDNETFYVDESAPEITKTVGEPNCPVPDTDDYCVTTDTEITVTAVDQGCCPGCGVTIEYRIWYDGVWTSWTEYTVPFNFTEECEHILQIRAYDCLGNGMDDAYWDTETFYVDETPPTITKTVGDPKCPVPGTDDWCVTTATEITLDAHHGEDCCPWNDIDLEYRIWWNGVWTPWADYTDPITFDEECMHYLEVRATDCLGNEAFDNETFYVDESSPVITKTVGDPNCPVPGTDDYCVTTETEITVTAEDQGCGPCAGDLTIEYRIWWNGVWTPWTTYIEPISFDEECMHYLEIKASDCLGNEAYDNETFYVDEIPPELIKTVGDPHVYLGEDPYGHDIWMVYPETDICFEAIDLGCCEGGGTFIYYRYWYLGNWTDWMEYEGCINLVEGCVHYLEAKAEDCLGNFGPVDNETFWVCAPGGQSGPEISIVVPSWGETYCDRTLEVIIEASDIESSPEELIVIAWIPAQDAAPRLYYYAVYDDSDGYFHAFIDIYKYQDGTALVLEALVFDGDGNYEEAIGIPFEVCSTVIFDQWMKHGWNRLTLPWNAIPCDDSIESVLASIDGSYAGVFYYDIATDSWYSFVPGEPHNSLDSWEAGKDYWVHISGDGLRFYTDTQGPDVEITIPEDGDEFEESTGEPGVIDVYAYDVETHIAGVYLEIYDQTTDQYYNGSVWQSTQTWVECYFYSTDHWDYYSYGIWTAGHTYDITARAYDAVGCYGEDAITISILGGEIETILTIDPSSLNGDIEVKYFFTLLATDIPSGLTEVKFEWNWGDGNTGSTQAPVTGSQATTVINHTYYAVGAYGLIAVVKDLSDNTLDDAYAVVQIGGVTAERNYTLDECYVWEAADAGGYGITVDNWNISEIPIGSTIDIQFDCLSQPDKIIVEYPIGNVVLNTGWRGSSAYNGNPLYPGGIAGIGQGQEDNIFTKGTENTCRVTVIGGEPGTIWYYWLRSNCPS